MNLTEKEIMVLEYLARLQCFSQTRIVYRSTLMGERQTC